MEDIKIAMPDGKTLMGKDGSDKTEITLREPTGKEFFKYGPAIKFPPMFNPQGEMLMMTVQDEEGNDQEVPRTSVEVDQKVIRQYLCDCADVSIGQIEKLPMDVVDRISASMSSFLVPQELRETK